RIFRRVLGAAAEVESEGIRASWVQAVIARGGRELGRALLQVHRSGSFSALRRVAQSGERSPLEPLPWECVDVRVDPGYLRREYLRYLEGEPSPECFPGCRRCGACG
ncbi:MAG: hypothetical protein GXN98_01235, partial [Euryarchaeota archaeon]|nr:hypothetical protein [Euryarchaeota archaeon]